MSKPTGKLSRFGDGMGGDLEISRSYRAPIEDVWASVTEPERTARWFGPWEGQAVPGRTIKVRLDFEEAQPWCEAVIEACDAPRLLEMSVVDEHGGWRLSLLLSEQDGVTELKLVHHLDKLDAIGEVGPGWEYYLDMLTAAREGSPRPDFNDYYPAMKDYFTGL
ncbi:uncharacterized protein YndB with AHSA1/START domain [Crossiella equi]|uniref:Uncharacterized protein YndB with AHSA1/START domain n=1 Tax=Crossiella equi TaxID=130796 RepID=A0ABS5A8W0_9PSEU|nr:SRPBCC family protein [Crossiella equi]MBP2473038.1 uncharacterized protein YndB with AHSA1/START domain [Crossiella equi]